MNKEIEIKTKEDLERAIKNNDISIISEGDFYVIVEDSKPTFIVKGSAQLHITALESSQPHIAARESSRLHITAQGSSQPHITAWESSQPHITARESSQPHITAWESSQPSVEAYGYVQLSISGAVKAKLSSKVSVLIYGTKSKVIGGKQTKIEIKSAEDWLDYYGIEINDGIAVLFKSVKKNFMNAYNEKISYKPGYCPKADDWDGGKKECGGGLHFSPSPSHAKNFYDDETFIACPIEVKEIVVYPDGEYPEKVKAPRVCSPCWQVDIEGNKIDP